MIRGVRELVVLAVMLGACRHAAPEPPRVVYAPAPCLSAADAPPPAPRPEAVAGPEEGCPAVQGCVTPELYLWVAESLRWARSAWTKCGPPATPADGGE